MADISVLKNGKVKTIRLSTLNAICRDLDCQGGRYFGISGVESCQDRKRFLVLAD